MNGTLPDPAARYLPVVRALALAGTLDPEGATRVTERAMARFVAGLSGTEDPARLLALAEEATRAEARTWVDEHGGRTTHIVGIPPEAAARARLSSPSLPEIFGDVPARRAALMLLEAVSWVPPPYEVLLLLRYLEGLDYASIAEIAGTSVREAGASLDSARRLFERELCFHLARLAGP